MFFLSFLSALVQTIWRFSAETLVRAQWVMLDKRLFRLMSILYHAIRPLKILIQSLPKCLIL